MSNLYYCIKKKFKGRKLNYDKLMDYLEGYGKIEMAKAYGAQMDNEAEAFIERLEDAGFETIYQTPRVYRVKNGKERRKADWDVTIAMEMLDVAASVDLIILCTADGDLKPAVERVQSLGTDVIVLACAISRDLRDAAFKDIEIPESLLQ